MDELRNVSLLFFAFGVALAVYGFALKRTGNVNLMPYHVTHSISSPEDVRRVGTYVLRIGLVLTLITGAFLLVSPS